MIHKDYYSPIHCLGAKQRTPSPSSVAFYDMPGKVWAASIFFVPVLAREYIIWCGFVPLSPPPSLTLAANMPCSAYQCYHSLIDRPSTPDLEELMRRPVIRTSFLLYKHAAERGVGSQ